MSIYLEYLGLYLWPFKTTRLFNKHNKPRVSLQALTQIDAVYLFIQSFSPKKIYTLITLTINIKYAFRCFNYYVWQVVYAVIYFKKIITSKNEIIISAPLCLVSDNIRKINLSILSSVFILTSCGMTRPPEISTGHIDEKKTLDGTIPEILKAHPVLPKPSKRKDLKTYTVIVSDVSLKSLLFSIARDAGINLDLHDDIEGQVSINAIEQSLPKILYRLSEQANIRYEIKDNYLSVREDNPFFRNYKIDYVNLERKSSSTVRVATTLGSAGSSNIGGNKSSAGSGGRGSSGGRSASFQDNSSLTEIRNESKNDFWITLEENIIKLIGASEKSSKDTASSAENNAGNNNVIVNKEGGVIVVKATEKQHKKLQAFIDQVVNNAKRQVLIEATIAEIKLSDRYQSGVDWSVLTGDPASGVSFDTDLRGTNIAASPFTALSITDLKGDKQLSLTLRALEKFGDVKVLSSPKVMAINNQPAILKVVDNFVYFEMNVDSSVSTNVAVTTFDTEIKAVPVGFVMSVIPYINENGVVTLNIRPTISRIIDTVEDPNPEFARANVSSRVPVIQVREIESILQVNSGDTAIIGGLMQDTVNENTTGVPFLSSLPLIGNLFSYRDDAHEKSELIIFIRPIVVTQASLQDDLETYKQYLPKKISSKSN